MSCPLTAFHKAFVLSLFPPGTRITAAHYMQSLVPSPIHVRVTLPDGTEEQVVLRIARNRGGVEREALVLPVLARLGLPVPAVLAGPVSDLEDAQAFAMSLHSWLPGRTLHAWSEHSGTGLEFAIQQTIEAVSRLHQLTDRIQQDAIGSLLPHKTLSSELRNLLHGGNPWMQDSVVESAVARLLSVVDTLDTPLVFSNGDYQPANFLAEGGRLTGFVDFEKACFEDPLITLARYPVYNLNPLYQAGVVTRFLQERGFSDYDFAPRLALFCLRTLVTKVPVSGGTQAQQERREHVLTLLTAALSLMEM
jgi:aminoglycoside phosphotransferase (APT) family kinase protein